MSRFSVLLCTLGLFLGGAAVARANDTAIPKIDVRKIEGTARLGEEMKFSGQDAKKFFEMIPFAAVSVPAEERQQAKEYRTLMITDRAGRKQVTIECTKVRYDNQGNKHAIPTECTIALKGYDPDAPDLMTFDFTPACTFSH